MSLKLPEYIHILTKDQIIEVAECVKLKIGVVICEKKGSSVCGNKPTI